MSDTVRSDPNDGSLDLSSYDYLDAEHVPSKPKEETDVGTLKADSSEYKSPSSLDVAEEKDVDSIDASLVPLAEETLTKEDPKPEEETDVGTLKADEFDATYSLPDAEEKDSLVQSTEETSQKEDPKPEEETDKGDLKADNLEQQSPSLLGDAEEKDGDSIDASMVPSTEKKPKKEDPKLEEETDKGDLKADNSECELSSLDVTKEKDGDTTNVSLLLSDSPSHQEKEGGISPFSPLESERNSDLKTDKVIEDKSADSIDTQDVDPKKLNGSGLIPNEPANVQQKKDLEDEKIERKPKWVQEKEKCLAESIEERRKKRKCTELSSIKTWPEYYRHLKKENNMAEPDLPDISNKISIWTGDITSLLVDAIVNAANETLMGGGGVDGAIHSAAGRLLKEECKKFNGCSIGEAVMTAGYNLPAKYVIHTVGPRGEYPHKLSRCYLNSLQCLIDENQRSIAFPCISTGIFGYPNDKAAQVVVTTLRSWLEKNHEKVDRVIFCLFLEKDVHLYEQHLQTSFPMRSFRSDDIATEPSSNEILRSKKVSDETYQPTVPVQNNPNHSTEHAEEETASLLSTGSIEKKVKKGDDPQRDHQLSNTGKITFWNWVSSLFIAAKNRWYSSSPEPSG